MSYRAVLFKLNLLKLKLKWNISFFNSTDLCGNFKFQIGKHGNIWKCSFMNSDQWNLQMFLYEFKSVNSNKNLLLIKGAQKQITFPHFNEKKYNGFYKVKFCNVFTSSSQIFANVMQTECQKNRFDLSLFSLCFFILLCSLTEKYISIVRTTTFLMDV